jgi:hypothetical protein
MLSPKKTRDMARNLISSETRASQASLQAEPATIRVYERLRTQLGALVGVGGFQALASRALALAKSESPRLSAVKVTENGGLLGLGEARSLTDTEEDREVGIILIAQLLGLFLTFLGEATTLRLIEDLRLQVDAPGDSTAAAQGPAFSSANEPERTMAFTDLLRETDRLRSVSQHIEALVDKHPSMEEGLVSVAGNIRSIASVLDIFTLIRSKAGGSQEDGPDPETNRFMN